MEATTNNEGQRFLINQGTGVNTNFELGYDTGSGSGSGNFGIHRGNSNASITAPGTISSNTFALMSTIVGPSGAPPSNVSIFKSGVSQTLTKDNLGWLGAGSYDTSSRPIDIGARNDQGFGTFNGQRPGDIAEVVIYTGALTTAERQSVECYLSAKYGL